MENSYEKAKTQSIANILNQKTVQSKESLINLI
ncbi:hypothetical protein CLU81_0195 [Flavobacterium sp. 9]|nr:hypothetical protein CLU81_0195 [Flavobacterium sp. 9]